MATASIPTSLQAPPASIVSTTHVDTLEGKTSILKPKLGGSTKTASASMGCNPPRSQHELQKEAEPSPEAKTLIYSVLEVGKEWQSKRKTVTDYFEQYKLEVLKLRNEFGVKKGTKGKMLYVPQPDDTLEAMYWSDFVSLAFGVSERHINRLIGIPVESPDPPDPKKSQNYKAGFAAGQEAARRGQVEAPVVAQPVSKLDKDPYAYFEQLKGEKQTFASELAAMVVGMFEPTDTDEIVQAFGEEVKRQQELRNAEAARCALDKLACTKQPTARTSKTNKVLVARIGDTTEFGVFPDSCDEHTTTNALTIGTKQACEIERDRLNAKRAANVEPIGILLGTTTVQAQQTAVLTQ